MKKQGEFITVEQAIGMLKENDQILFGMAAAEPQIFAEYMHTAIDNGIKKLNITNCLAINTTAKYLTDEYAKNFKFYSWFYDPAMRKVSKNGNVSFIPNNLHFASKKRFYRQDYDVFMCVASYPDEHGYISLSLNNVYEKDAIKFAKMSIIEVNKNFPRTLGDMEVHVSEIDYLVETDYMPPALPDIPLNEKDRAIGKFIADLIPDGSCIQLGIGGIPNAVAEALKGKKNLGIHTEMFTSKMVELIESGAVDGSLKQLQPGKHVAAFCYANQKTYDFINNNPTVQFLRGSYVNDPHIIGLNDNQISINSTIEVDLTGQCASESLGHVQFSGTGGQTDTAVGAVNSKNGKSFIALYSTALVRNKETGEKEEVSKIVATLKPGAAVSLSRNDVDHVCTEYGVVNLRGTSIDERVELLISIAHPKFREQLRKEAIALGWLYE